jgi:cobalt-precorrin-5B (C1)-methyltransferase
MLAMRTEKPEGQLRRGWTTGACAAAAVKAAATALLTGEFPDPVEITLPKGQNPSFALARQELAAGFAAAAIIKDAGDDPDVTHGAVITASVRLLPQGHGVIFKAGDGVGTVTKPGLPLAIGEPAINPVPRSMIVKELEALGLADVEVTISVPGGAALAEKTWNPRLGIIGGISILGTTGIVNPYSCAAWIASIHRGIDVAKAMGLPHVAGCTGSTSEDAVRAHFGLPLEAMLDMGDFAGGLLKYLKVNPVARVTIGGGFGKITKLAQGAMDLHSGRSQVDNQFLAARVPEPQRDLILKVNTAAEAYDIIGKPLAERIAEDALVTVRNLLADAPIVADVVIVDRKGQMIAHAQ